MTLEGTLHALQGEAAEHYPRYGIMPQGTNARGLWPSQTAAPRVEVSNAQKERGQTSELQMEVRLPAQHLPSQVMALMCRVRVRGPSCHSSNQAPPLVEGLGHCQRSTGISHASAAFFVRLTHALFLQDDGSRAGSLEGQRLSMGPPQPRQPSAEPQLEAREELGDERLQPRLAAAGPASQDAQPAAPPALTALGGEQSPAQHAMFSNADA